MSVEYLDCSIAMPTSAGSDDNGVNHEIGMTFGSPRQIVVTKATGPPISKEFASDTGSCLRSSSGGAENGDPNTESVIGLLLHAEHA